MKKRKILYLREPEVHAILEQQLVNEGYCIWPKIGVEEVIGAERKDHLTTREVQYLRNAHFDFVVAHRNEAVFAVEFDGMDHLNDRMAMERDVVKNRLCKMADLPLLRIMSREIQAHDHDQLTLLDYMLMRYVAWKDDYPEIQREIEDFASKLGPDYNLEHSCTDFDPSFRFDLRHPFPGTALARERLWRNYGIAWTLETDRLAETPLYVCDVTRAESGSLVHDQFHICRQRATLWKGDDRSSPIFTEKVSASSRSWLPVYNHMPDQPHFDQLWKDFYSSPTPQKVGQEIVQAFYQRVENMWWPELPGVRATQIAENYSEYLGFRAIERWAKKELFRAPSRASLN